ncbi:unnamed protein product, partial [Pylaiella littoralis]
RPEFLQTLQRLYPNEFCTKEGKDPRKYKGDYCCQLFSKIRLGMDKSQKLRTRTVTSGFTSTVVPTKKALFQGIVDEVVDHLSRVRILASLFANFLILYRIEHGIEIPEVNEKFYTSCLSACSEGSRGGGLNGEFNIFQEKTGLTRISPPLHPITKKPISVSQQRTYIAGTMSTSTSTRMVIHSEKRRIAITRWFIARKLGNVKNLLHTLSEFIIKDFDGTPESTVKLGEKIVKFGTSFTTSSPEFQDILEFSTKELTFSKTMVEKEHSLMIKHLKWMFDTYVGISRKEYDRIVKEATNRFQGKDSLSKKMYRDFIEDNLRSTNGTSRTPPKDAAVLPICSSTSVFIRIDIKTLKYWGFECSDDAWWYSSVINPYSKKANIKCLISKENSKYSSSQEGYLSSLLGDGPDKCPWMVGSSFLTDGFQVKTLLTTLLSTSKPFSGSSELDNAGYNKLPRADTTIQELITIGRGVYNIESLDACDSLPRDTIFMSADPGQAKVINVTSASTETWEKRDPELMFSLCSHVTGEEYRRDILAIKSEEYEVWRKNDTGYGLSIGNLSEQQKRTSSLDKFLDYCKCWFRNGTKLLEETLHRIRRVHRFTRFRKTQSKLAKIADKYMGKITDKCKVMLFGKASFKAQKGRASAPRKSMIREMASRGVVLMVKEYNTSKKCPGCKVDLVEDKERRIRSCINFNVGSPENSCKLNSVEKEYDMDRDNVGSINIGMRGVGLLLGQNWF